MKLKESRATGEDILQEVLRPHEGPIVPASVPWYFLAAPTVSVDVDQCSVIIAPRDLDFATAMTFRQASGLVCFSKVLEYPKHCGFQH